VLCRPWFAVHIRLFVPYSLTVIPRQPQKPVIPPSTVHFVVCRPRSAVRRPHSFIRSLFVDGLPRQPQKPVIPPSTVYRPPSISLSAVRGWWSILPSAVCGLRSTFVYSFPIRWRSSPASLKSQSYHRPRSTVHRPFRRPPSVVCGLSCRPRFAVHIRLFVPYSLTVCPASLKSLPYHRPPPISPSAVRGLRSIPPSAVCGPPSLL